MYIKLFQAVKEVTCKEFQMKLQHALLQQRLVWPDTLYPVCLLFCPFPFLPQPTSQLGEGIS